MDLHTHFWEMVEHWREILRQPNPRATRQEACLALLVALIDKLATARVGEPNAPVRFFADMVRLHKMLAPFMAADDFGRIALSPAWTIVGNWLHANAHANGGLVDVDRFLDFEQLRAAMLGEQPGWTALDPVRLRSDYVQAILGRVIETNTDPT